MNMNMNYNHYYFDMTFLADTELCGTKRKDSRPFHRERNWKATSFDHQNSDKDRNNCKSQQNTSLKSKQKCKTERPTYFHKTSEKGTKR